MNMKGRSAFLTTLLLILVFALAAFNRYGKGGEPPAPLFPTSAQSSQSVEPGVEENGTAAPGQVAEKNPLVTTVKTLVEEQRSMAEPPADGLALPAKAQDLVNQAERLISRDDAEPAPAVSLQPVESNATLQSDDAYQRRMAGISHLRDQLAELKAKQQPTHE